MGQVTSPKHPRGRGEGLGKKPVITSPLLRPGKDPGSRRIDGGRGRARGAVEAVDGGGDGVAGLLGHPTEGQQVLR